MSSILVPSPPGGWAHPWVALIELAAALAHTRWVLVGGLMVQLHAMSRAVAPLRATHDMDVLLDVRTQRTAFGEAVSALRQLGYAPIEPNGAHDPAHRFTRHGTVVDLAVDEAAVDHPADIVDVLVPDHLHPNETPRLMRRPAMAIEGGRQALGRTVMMRLDVVPGTPPVDVAVPDLLGALVLKGAAFAVDSRDRQRHLQDAALLASLMLDPAPERARLAGSDRKRLRSLARPDALGDAFHPAWLLLPPDAQVRGQDTLRLLLA